MDFGDLFGHITRPGGDRRTWTTGRVEAVDDSGARLEVMVDGALVVLPRVDGDYEPDDSVLVIRDPESTGAGQFVVGTIAAVRPEPEPEPELPVTGTVTSINQSAGTVRVSTSAGSFDCRFVGTVMSTGATVRLDWPREDDPWVLGVVGTVPPPLQKPPTPGGLSLSRDGATVNASWNAAARATSYRVRTSGNGSSWSNRGWQSGRSIKLSVAEGKTLYVQVQARNAAGESGWSGTQSVSRPKSEPKYETVKTTIKPSDSGTYRDAGGWNRWNGSKYGGFPTLYQGSAFGSGPLRGWAGYGNKIKNLDAVEITKIVVKLRGAGLALASYPSITVQGSPHGSRPGGKPSVTGDTASGKPGKSGVKDVTLPASTYEAWRKGDIAGLCTVGGGYNAVRGTSAADGMVLEVTYRKRK